MPELVAGLRVDGPTLLIELGTIVAEARGDGDRDAARAVIDLQLANAEPPPSRPGAPPAPAAAPPVVDFSATGQLRTVVIDPGHGGTDTGARSAGGAFEKDITLAIAQRLKAAIESRLGLRVLLTREADTDVAVDRRTALANNNKADVFISLHANGSLRNTAAGATIFSATFPPEAEQQARASLAPERLPTFGGGVRDIELVPWDLAQLRHIDESVAFATILEGQLRDHVPLAPHPVDQAPLRILGSANMPAVLIEMGFLTNEDQEKALAGSEFQTAFVQAIYDSILKFRDRLAAGGTR
jgi:N-acetylmuramoyl-L-alanine amidase